MVTVLPLAVRWGRGVTEKDSGGHNGTDFCFLRYPLITHWGEHTRFTLRYASTLVCRDASLGGEGYSKSRNGKSSRPTVTHSQST